MLKIYFTGTSATHSKLQAALMGYALVVTSGDADVMICEVSSADDFKKVPLKPDIPLFLMLNTKSKKVVEHLKSLKINGIFVFPPDAAVIKNKINAVMKTQYMQSTNKNMDTLKIKILAKAETINALPVFAQKLLRLIMSDESTTREITEQIKMDQGLSSKVIRMVNSPFYGLRQVVASIDRAVVLLGAQTLKNIALVAAINSYYTGNYAMYNTTGKKLWEHTYNVALISEAFALEVGEPPEMMFLAGLLHDIGKILLVDFLQNPVDSCEEEDAQLGTNHAAAAGYVLAKWQLPEEVIHIIALHHNPDDTIRSKILYYANILEHAAHINESVHFNKVMEFAFMDIPVKNREEFTQRLFTMLTTPKE